MITNEITDKDFLNILVKEINNNINNKYIYYKNPQRLYEMNFDDNDKHYRLKVMEIRKHKDYEIISSESIYIDNNIVDSAKRSYKIMRIKNKIKDNF